MPQRGNDDHRVQQKAALAVRRSLDLWHDGATVSPRKVLRKRGWEWEIVSFGSQTTILSLLLPRDTGGFAVLVNSDHSPSSVLVDWLIAHELAHALFYTGGLSPRRRVTWTLEEETFCDAFANVLVPNAAEVARKSA